MSRTSSVDFYKKTLYLNLKVLNVIGRAKYCLIIRSNHSPENLSYLPTQQKPNACKVETLLSFIRGEYCEPCKKQIT